MSYVGPRRGQLIGVVTDRDIVCRVVAEGKNPMPERQRPWVEVIVRRAYQATDVKTATRLLTDLAKRLDDEYLSAAGSVREGLDETLTVLTLHLSARLQRSLATTNAAEGLLSRTSRIP